MRLGLATTRAVLSAAETSTIPPAAAAATASTAAADGARSLYRAALRHIRALKDGHVRSYHRAYARQSINAFRDEQGDRVAQLLKHGREAAEFLSKKHGVGSEGGGGGGKGKGGGGGGGGRGSATTAASGSRG